MLRKAAISAFVALGFALTGAAGEAKEWTHVNLGSEGAFPPWNLIGADGKLAGLEIDLANDLCRRVKLDCTIGVPRRPRPVG